jgi:glutathione S-transferase
MSFLVHTVPGSPYGRAVLAALEEKGARYRLAPVPAGAFKSPDHLARHPFGRVPVLEHGDFALYETQAILRYLDRILPEPALTPRDPRAAARMDQAMNVNDWYLFQGVANVVVFERVVGPRLFKRPTDESALALAMPKARIVFPELARLLGDRPWFAGDTFSLADLMIAPQLDLFRLAPEWRDLTESAPALRAYVERAEARASFQATTWAQVAKMAA